MYRTNRKPYPANYQPTCIGLYARMSHDTMDAEGVEQQLADLEDLAAELYPGIPTRHYTDNDEGASALSANNGERDEYARMIGDANDGIIDALLAPNMDRWTRVLRDVIDSIEWMVYLNIPFTTLEGDTTRTHAGIKAMKQKVLDAEYEVQRISQRMKARNRRRRMAGRFGSVHRRYGWAYDSNKDGKQFCYFTEHDEHEAEIVRGLYERAAKGMPPAELLRWVRSVEPVRNLKGKPVQWMSNTVNEMLRCPTYAGGMSYEGKPLRNDDGSLQLSTNINPIVSVDEWETVQRVISERPVVSVHNGERRHVLAGLVICSLCGAKMAAEVYNRNGKRRARWACTKARGGCGHMMRDYRAVHNMVMEFVEGQIKSGSPVPVTLPAETDTVSGRIAALEGKIAALDALRGGAFSDAEIAMMMETPRAELHRLQSQRETAARKVKAASMADADSMLKVLHDETPQAFWQRRSIITDEVDRIVIKPARRSRGVDLTSIEVVPKRRITA
jgi:DNA invertase Pin-like site-specific DNA recombinase